MGHVSFREGSRRSCACTKQNPAVVLARLAYREENKMIDTFDPMTQRKEHRGCVFDADTVKRFISLGGF